MKSYPLAIGLALLSGCASPGFRYHTLQPASGQSATSTSHDQVRLTTVQIPAEVDTEQLVVRASNNTLVREPTDRWAAPLTDEIRGALDDAWQRDDGLEDVQNLGDGSRSIPQVGVQVQKLDATLGGNVELIATWWVSTGEGSTIKTWSCQRVIVGAFSFAHALEDSQAAVDYLRVPANARRLRVAPDKIVLLGHSMGGWMALATGASDANVRGVIAISAADMPDQAGNGLAKYGSAKVIRVCVPMVSEAFYALAGDTPEAACRELVNHAEQWSLSNDVKGLATRPVFLITSDDGYELSAESFAKALRAAGSKQVHEAHLTTDHSYSDKRIALTQVVLDDLDILKLQ